MKKQKPMVLIKAGAGSQGWYLLPKASKGFTYSLVPSGPRTVPIPLCEVYVISKKD